jgi:bacillithiol biosynthesis cysteine-adding enzyme BshC
MQASCVRHTDLPGTSKIFADALYHFPRVAPFYAYPVNDSESYVAAAAKLTYPDSRRAALVSALREYNGDSPALQLLAKPGTVAVVTGQQVGLFSGPCYTVYKALTAVKLARTLTENGTPAVPVFWLATEDHDLEEVRHAWVFDSAQNPVKLSASSSASETPVGNIPFDSYPVSELRDALNGLPFAEEVLQQVEAAYTPGATLGAAFLALVKQLFAGFDLLYIDPLQPSIRAIAAPLLKEAIERAPELIDRVLERNAELTAAGYHAQVHMERDSSLFFLLNGGRRTALKRSNEHYTAKDQRFSIPELAARAEEISPNALLRPVVQDYLLPTVAHVGGPAEVAYLAQSQVLYQALNVHAPVEVSRSGFTLLDSRASKLMQRYQLELKDFFHGENALKDRLASRLVPATLAAKFERTHELISAQLEALQKDLLKFDPTLAAALKKSQAKMLYQLTKSQGKLERATLRRDAAAAQDAAYIYNLIYPHRHLQERFYSILPLMARYGPDLIQKVYDNIRLDCPDHVVLSV